MASDEKAGSLLRVLVASRSNGRFLELGTGIGASLCWMLDGMDKGSSIISIDNDPELISVSEKLFGKDSRLSLLCEDGAQWIKSYQGVPFDLVFADAWPGKYSLLEETLDLIKPGGFYVIDDMLPQPNWPDGHAEKASILLEHLAQRKDLVSSTLEWSTGVIVCTRI
ncbi:MAG: hypothetical protein DHS20C17_03750 [Cyclobacteriaceae bacterium]|nr:MAG: hypothetical protein DHS20C17_03750 [Cyclobacteriaceae bacterium]